MDQQLSDIVSVRNVKIAEIALGAHTTFSWKVRGD